MLTVAFFFCNQFLVASFGTGKSIYPSQCSLHVFPRFMRTMASYNPIKLVVSAMTACLFHGNKLRIELINGTMLFHEEKVKMWLKLFILS